MSDLEKKARIFSNTEGNQSSKLMREVEYDTGRYVGYLAGFKDCQKEYEEKLRWIPVEEKLPEIDESLSKSDLHYSISVEVMNGVKIQSAYFNTETGKWRSLITGYIINPTHWRRFL